jgi:hypothetical protein
MHRWIGLICLPLLVTATARADLLPTPDPGPYSGSAGGLHFSIRSVTVEMGPVLGPHYFADGAGRRARRLHGWTAQLRVGAVQESH